MNRFPRAILLVVFGASLVFGGAWLWFGKARSHSSPAASASFKKETVSAAFTPATSATPAIVPLSEDTGFRPKDADQPRLRNSLGQVLPFRERILPGDFLEKLTQTKVGDSVRLQLFPDAQLEVKVSKRAVGPHGPYQVMSLPGYQAQDTFFLSIAPGKERGLVQIPSRNLAFEILRNSGGEMAVKEWLFSDRVCASPAPDRSLAERGSPRPTVYTDPERGRAPRGIDPADVPPLESRPGVVKVFYLDFDGESVPESAWGGPILAPAARMTPNQVRQTWERVCRDFDPFDVNITTIRSVYNAAPETSRIMCVITANDAAAPGAGGVAYLESFTTDEASGMKVCWAFIDDDSKNSAEVISHEIGHTLSLTHDGRLAFLGEAREEYFLGHGDGVTGWAPIMGAGYYKNVTQWSRGEYFRANNPEDDLAAIALRLDYLPAAHGGDLASATENTNAVATGFIGEGNLLRATNSEVFLLRNLPMGMHTIEVAPFEAGNLDAKLEILNADGSTNRVVDPEQLLGVRAIFATTNTNALYLKVASAGLGQPTNQNALTGYKVGYSTYGSLGRYRLLYLRQVEFAQPFITTSLAGRYFSRALFFPNQFDMINKLISNTQVVLSSNTTSTNPGTGVIDTTTIRRQATSVFSNNLYEITPSFFRTNGLTLNRLTGLLEGLPTTNFILEFSNEFTVAITNKSWSRTTINTRDYVTVVSNLGTVTNSLIRQVSASNNISPTNILPGGVFTNTNRMRLVFQSPAVVTFTNTNMPAVGSLTLPATNPLGLRYGYRLISGGTLQQDNGTNMLVSTSSLPALLQVSLSPTSPALEIWTSNSANFRIFKTNPPAAGFAFETNPSRVPHTRTNLAYLETTPLVVTNAGLSRVSFTPGSGGVIFFSNHPVFPSLQIPYFRATNGIGTNIVTAVLAATISNAATTSTVSITLTQAPAPPIIMQGIFANPNGNNAGGEYTHSSLGVTTLPLQVSSGGGYRVGFLSSDPSVARITNGSTLVLVGSGTCNILATHLFLNTNRHLVPDPVTNTLVVAWPEPSAPVFTSTNRKDGIQGANFTHFLQAEPNSDPFPVAFAVTNLPPGLVWVPPNRIQGVPTHAGLFRIETTASNQVGTITNSLLVSIASQPPFYVTNSWSLTLSLGTSQDISSNCAYLLATKTNSNGLADFTAPNPLPAGIGMILTNDPDHFAGPILVLTNTNPTIPAGFTGVLDPLWVRFTNPASGQSYETNLKLTVLPPLVPALSYSQPRIQTNAGAKLVITNQAPVGGGNSAPRFKALNLPPGLSLLTNGNIQGFPSVAGIYTSMITAMNRLGSVSTNLVFEVNPVAGYSMALSLAALFDTNMSGSIYTAINLPPGLVLSTNSGLVRGSPLALGAFAVTVTRSNNGTQESQTTNLFIQAPPPSLQLPAASGEARAGQPFLLQPWVTSAGLGWAGADPLRSSQTNTAYWTNRLILKKTGGTNSSETVTNRISANVNGAILATTNGLTFTNNSNANSLALLWRNALPSSWPWVAVLRMQIPGPMVLGQTEPFLGLFRAQAMPEENFYDLYAEAFLSSRLSGKRPGAAFLDEVAYADASLEPVGTNEIAVSMSYDTNGPTLVMAINTNPASSFSSYQPILTNVGMANGWTPTNGAAAYRIWAGFYASNSRVSLGQAFLRGFALLPGELTFTASNLPAWATLDSVRGTIAGIPTSLGTNSVTNTIVITVSNASGTSQGTYRLIVRP